MSALFDDQDRRRQAEAELGITAIPSLMVRILWWLSFAPEQYEATKKKSPKRVKQASKWLAITLVWLTLLIPAVGGATYNVPYTYDSNDLKTLLLWAVGGWIVTLFLSRYENPYAIFLAGSVSFCISLAVLFGMSASAIFSLIVAVAVIIVFGIMDGVVDGVAIGTMFGITIGAVLNLTIQVFVGVFLAMVLVLVLLAFYVAASVVARVMERAKKSGHVTVASRVIFILLVAAYAIMIWYTMLGGYRMITGRS